MGNGSLLKEKVSYCFFPLGFDMKVGLLKGDVRLQMRGQEGYSDRDLEVIHIEV